MKSIIKVFIILFICISNIYANDFRDIVEISLKKDEQKKILVKYGKIEKLFKFSWTLYKNGGLVVFRSYDKIVAQNVLYLRHSNRSFRLELKSRGADFYNVPYMLVKFKEFKFETNEAVFELFLSDKQEQISLKYLKNG